jgi:hypothetical protein|tara:strand:+ start:886 stop:1380 length:495 start_codon:yes stop_codon:yes gene_type:complete
MNIFYLDKDPIKAAEMACDKHTVKMILESAQMLSTAHRVLDNITDDRLYKKTHVNHPSSKWVRESAYHYNWLYKHMIALNEEYKKRYGKKDHLTITKLGKILRNPPKNIPLNKIFKDPTPAMPEHCKIKDDVVGSYRKYYILEKSNIATWKEPSRKPDWFNYHE